VTDEEGVIFPYGFNSRGDFNQYVTWYSRDLYACYRV